MSIHMSILLITIYCILFYQLNNLNEFDNFVYFYLPISYHIYILYISLQFHKVESPL